MPAGDSFPNRGPSSQPRALPSRTLPSSTWAVCLPPLGGLQIRFSYGIFIAAAVLILIAIFGSASPGNADLPRVIAFGSFFWVSGWLAQATAYLITCWLLGSQAKVLCLGLLGVEQDPRHWPARHALLATLAAIAALILLGSFYRLIEGDFRFPQIVRTDQSIWSAPSLGFSKLDSVWRSAAWLCLAQAVFQLYPLPRTLGRQLVASLTAICSSNLELPLQTIIFRRCLVTVSLLTMAVTIALELRGTLFLGVSWIVLLILALTLWISSRWSDMERALAGFQSAAKQDASRIRDSRGSPSPLDIVSVFRQRIGDWRTQRRLRAARSREQGEAIDARRLDEILTRLHREGIATLSIEDRRLLERVSESLRRQRSERPIDEVDGD